tara:strand:+ start:782 stop:1138 length:357 start_codon:yes stop_codon:yes gene_type:complete
MKKYVCLIEPSRAFGNLKLVAAIKAFRNVTRGGLKESRDAVKYSKKFILDERQVVNLVGEYTSAIENQSDWFDLLFKSPYKVYTFYAKPKKDRDRDTSAGKLFSHTGYNFQILGQFLP